MGKLKAAVAVTTGNVKLPVPRRERSTPRRIRALTLLVAVVCALVVPSRAAAHSLAGSPGLRPIHGAGIAFVGLAVVAAGVLGKRSGRVTATRALGVAFGGLLATVIGVVLLDVLSPDLLYDASSMPFPRSWYEVIRAGLGIAILLGSFVVGWLRWPGRPRYTFLGILLALWILYPQLIPGYAGAHHPLGYAIVLATPLAVGYVLWREVGGVLRETLRDTVARRFGAGVAGLTLLFFLTLSGYLSVFPEEGVPHRTEIVVLPVVYQLVAWPTLELSFPHIPFFLALSPGQLLVGGLLSVLVGLNAALVARSWRESERAGVFGAAGSASIVGSCTCGCCGPLLAKVVVLVAGPSIAAPVYWLFVDTASPLSTAFIVASIVLFTGSLLRAIGTAEGRQPGESDGAGQPTEAAS
ncbi:hypothetical protein B4589_003570 [Halolamina sp. CBA1230]|uniref:hypothetical protein n=1 Tax=Halolamina sp. CBA1230 TaxID=1853690 RepID=UPI0009A2334F|nr:hypothetical protein [Halolamina sp. CBA1230]QKY19499.1 hypothetical protein B4589_003570 [Halolamina sp. CBA1230]